ncbi:thioredoxin fold domain-containing protein [bacterium]|nr:thioredoxin fold domain-containing protein [bacterium]
MAITMMVFTRVGCIECEKLQPIIGTFKERYPDVSVVELDLDNCPDAQRKYNIQRTPTMILFEGEEAVEIMQGLMPVSVLDDAMEELQ